MNIIGLTLLVYLLILILIAWLSYTKLNNHTDFFIAGKKGSATTVSGSLLATILGGSAVIGAVDAAPRLGWAISWFMINAAIGLLMIIPFSSLIHRQGRYTLPDLLESMHGSLPKTISTFIIPIAWIGIVAAQIIAAGKILESFAQIPYTYGIGIAGVVFIGYTIIGGQFSILKTDFLQSILLLTGLFLLTVFVYRYTKQLQLIIPAQPSFFNTNFSPFDLIILILTYSTTFSTGPDIYSRLFCARSERTVRKALLISGLTLIPVALSLGYLGMAATHLVPGDQSGTLLVNLSKLILPPWGVAIMVVALLSAVLSSADTTLLSASVIVSERILKDQFGAKTVGTTRVVILIIGLLSVLLAWHFTSVIDLLLLALAIYAGAFTLPIFAGLLNIRIRPRYLSAAIISGGLIALAGKIVTFSHHGKTGNLLLISSFIISTLILWIGRYPRSSSPKESVYTLPHEPS